MKKILIISIAILLYSCALVPYGLEHKEGYLRKKAYLDSLRNSNKIPLLVKDIMTIGPNSAGGFSVRFDFDVYTNKAIKYLTFKGSFYNRVNDKVKCTIDRKNEYVFKVVGPIDKGNKHVVVFNDRLIYNSTIDCMNLNSIIIEYMDGTIENISSDEILNYLLPYDMVEYFGDTEPDPPYSEFYMKSDPTDICNYRLTNEAK